MVSRVVVINQHSIDHIKGKMYLKAPMLKVCWENTDKYEQDVGIKYV